MKDLNELVTSIDTSVLELQMKTAAYVHDFFDKTEMSKIQIKIIDQNGDFEECEIKFEDDDRIMVCMGECTHYLFWEEVDVSMQLRIIDELHIKHAPVLIGKEKSEKIKEH